jgi:hypothetical protein
MPRNVAALQESAALTFGAATSDRVDCGSAAILDDMTKVTVLAWVFPTTLATKDICSKFRNAQGGWRFGLNGATGNIEAQFRRATTNVDYISNTTPLATASQWYGIAMTLDQAVTPVAHMYTRTQMNALVSEVGYGTSNDGSGGFSADASWSLFIGNFDNSAGANSAFQGRIAVCAVFARVLTVAEIAAWFATALDDPFPAVMAGCRGLWYPGNEGASKVLDYSGYNNTGTVTGATLSRGVQLPARDAFTPFRPHFRAASGTAYTSSLSGALAPAGAVIKMVAAGKTGAFGPAGTLLKTFLKPSAGALTSAGAQARSIGKPATGTCASAGAPAKATGKPAAGVIASSGTIARLKVAILALAGALAPAGSVQRSIAKSLAAAIAWAGDLLLPETTIIVHPIICTVAYRATSVAAETAPQSATVSIAGYAARVTWPEV